MGYGAMQLERLADDRPRALAVVRRAVELGVDHVDTAQFYGDGFVNGVLGEALRGEEGAVVVSKIGADPDPSGPYPMRVAQRPEELRASVEENLSSLGVEQIPVVNLRRMDGHLRIPVPPEQQVDLDDQLAVMTALREEGLIGAIGLSNVTEEVLRRALPAGIVCVQNDYSLVARRDEELLALCEAEGIAWVPFFPLGGAMPHLPKVTDVPAVQDVAAELGATPAQVGLAWLLHRSPSTLLIPGTASIDHLEQNLAVGDIELDGETLARLEAATTATADDRS
jgi:aryl-alcohol dehydrogenase-like predicted oxidoreductase